MRWGWGGVGCVWGGGCGVVERKALGWGIPARSSFSEGQEMISSRSQPSLHFKQSSSYITATGGFSPGACSMLAAEPSLRANPLLRHHYWVELICADLTNSLPAKKSKPVKTARCLLHAPGLFGVERQFGAADKPFNTRLLASREWWIAIITSILLSTLAVAAPAKKCHRHATYTFFVLFLFYANVCD